MDLFLGKTNFQELKQIAANINFLEDGQVDYIISKDYYQGKLKGEFNYQRVEKEDEDDNDKQQIPAAAVSSANVEE